MKEYEEIFKSTFEQVAVGLAHVGLDGKFIRINQRLCDILKYSHEELLSLTIQDITYPDDRKDIIKARDSLLTGESSVYITEKRYIRKDRSLVWGNLTVSIAYNSEGAYQYFISVIEDITEKKERERKLIKSDEAYRNMINNLDIGFYKGELNGKLLIHNQKFNEILGFDPSESLVGSLALRFTDDKESLKKYHEKLINQGFIKDFILPIQDTKNNAKYVQLNSHLIKDENGIPIAVEGTVMNITEKFVLEQKLKQSEKRYRALLEDMLEGYYTVDFKGNYTYVNDYFCKTLECSKEEVLGKNYRFIYDEKTSKRLFKLFNQVYKSEIPLIHTSRAKMAMNGQKRVFLEGLITKRGKRVLHEGVIDLLYDSEGNKIGFYGYIRDITNKVTAEQNLKESEKKYRGILENMIEGYFENDLKGNYTFVNDYFCKILGYTREELLGKNYRFNYNEKRSKEVYGLYNQLYKNEISPPLIYEDLFLSSGGETTYIEGLADLRYDSEGIKIGFYGFIRDVTKRKRSEQNLKESENKYREILENMMEGYYEVDLKGNFTFFNNALCELLKYSPEESMGLYYKRFIDEENSKRIFEAFNEVYRTGIQRPRFQYELITKNGEKLFGETSISLKYDSDGRKIGFCGFLRDNTEKKIAEQNLQQSEKKYREILENMKEGYFEVDLRGNLTFVNDYYCKLLGHSSKEEILGKSYRVFQDEKTSDKLFKIYNSLYKNEIPTPVMLEREQLTPSGETIYYEALVSLKYNSEGNKVGFFGLMRDITERTEAEQKLKESEEKYRGILENIKEGYFESDLKGNYTFVNNHLCKILGYTREELLGKNYHMTHDEKSIKEVFKLFNQLYNNEISPPLVYERQVLTQSGETPFIEGLVELKYDSEGNKVGFFGLVRDITERKIAEQRLKESEEKFRLLTEQSLMGIGILQNNLYKYVNQEFANILGYTIGEILNWKPGEYNKIIYPKDRLHVREQSTKKQKGKNEVRNRYELRIIKKTGEIVWVEIFSGTIIYEGKKADLITISNITKRKKVEAVLEEQQKELKEINELKSEFLRRASHELKTPLISIKGFTNLLLHLHSEEFNPDVISMLFEVDQGCQRLEDIIHTIIKTTKLESSTLELHTSKEDLSFLIRFCIKELHFLVSSRNHTLIVNIQDKIITNFNKEQMYEVITNLISNSIKYTPPNGEIRIQTEINEKNVVVSIQDNGIGFTESEKKKIFQQFGKIERYGQGLDVGIDGTGLGLHISKKIIELHKGEIWMESEGKNRGSTFFFSLPLNST
ncbi:hypothetical protein LCGC14_0822190 [marine sediment metagenome]|uniref:histidine kinase n=1 Tax=marine sediment metagenome TaxID=412755 RepID=A0A0F9SR12_9ZZZZ